MRLESLEDRSMLAALSVNNLEIIERDGGSTIAEFSVSLSEPTGQEVTVDYETVENTARSLGTRRVASGLSAPLYAAAPTNDPHRLFIVENGGAIKILDLASGNVLPTPLLTVPNVGSTPEQGLLGLTFHPNFHNNGLLYTSQVRPNGQAGVSQVSQWKMEGDPLTSNTASTTSEDVILTVEQPFNNHNGGWLGFGPDGYLYVAMGDGGSGYDPQNHSQRLNSLLGKMLRIDVNADDFASDADRDYRIPADNPFANDGNPATLPEIWAYGLRNPWRNSFDRSTGNLYMADVGQRDREEINVQLAASGGGENYGWRVHEGTIPSPGVTDAPLSPADRVDPIFDYAHLDRQNHGQSLTGGYVYRGPIDALQGLYFFGDFITADLWSLRFDGSDPATHDGSNFTEFRQRNTDLAPDVGSIGFVSSFAEDSAGNVYIIDLVHGEVFLIDPLADYQPERGQLTFAPGQTKQTIRVQVFGDTRAEVDESFFVNLSNASNATIDDGQGVGTITRRAANMPPILTPIGDKSVSSSGRTKIGLTATDPNGDSLTFSLHVEQQATPVAELDLVAYDASYDNWGGRQEKWLRNSGPEWFFLLPNGELRAWNLDNPPTGSLIADVGASFHSDPAALINGGPGTSLPAIELQRTGPNTADLVIDANDFQGNSTLTVTVTDPVGTRDAETFVIDYERRPTTAPVLVSPIDNVTVNVNTARTEIDLFAAFQDADHTDRELLFSVTSNTNPSLVATIIDPATGKLIINFAENATGSSQLTVRASDPQHFFAEDTFNVTRTLVNNRPVLTHIGDSTLNHIGTTAIQVEASDPDGHPLSFDVAVESEAYLINQQFKLESHAASFDNWGGREEKWIRSRDFQWFFLLPNGELREWDRSGNATGNLIANVGSYFYSNPLALAEAKAGAVGLGTFTLESIGATRSKLVMSSPGVFNGRFQVTVTVTDSLGASDMETFTASR